jgi:hypothetical protein
MTAFWLKAEAHISVWYMAAFDPKQTLNHQLDILG